MSIPEQQNTEQRDKSIGEMNVEQLDELILELDAILPEEGLNQLNEELLKNIEL